MLSDGCLAHPYHRWSGNKSTSRFIVGGVLEVQILISSLVNNNMSTSIILACVLKAIDHSIYVSGFSCNPAASISEISVVLSGYRYILMFVHSGLLP